MSCVHVRVPFMPRLIRLGGEKTTEGPGAVSISGCKNVMNQSLCIDFCTALSGRVGFDSQVIR